MMTSLRAGVWRQIRAQVIKAVGGVGIELSVWGKLGKSGVQAVLVQEGTTGVLFGERRVR